MRTKILIFSISLFLTLVSEAFAQTITINPANQHQTIVGWGNAAGHAGRGFLTSNRTLVSDSVYNQILDENFINLGLTSAYAWPNGYVNWEGRNDNNDYRVPGTFDSTAADQWVSVAIEARKRVQSLGDNFTLLVRGGYANANWLKSSPGEYSENALTYLAYLKNTYNLDVLYWGVENEPSHGSSPVYHPMMAATMRELGPKFQAAGFQTKFMYPEGISAQAAWNYISPLTSDPTIWNYVGLMTWHLYGTQDPYRSNIYNFAHPRGIATGQTEAAAQGVLQLYYDLTTGGASYWAQGYALVGRGTGAGGGGVNVGPGLTSIYRPADFYHVRQVLRYVRPGAVRVDASSASSLVKALAFSKNNKITAIAINTDSAARTVILNGLPAGNYGVSQTVGSAPYQELGVRSISGPLSLQLAVGATVTVYPANSANQPPIPTDWRVTPEYLVAPTTSASLISSATDPDLDPISYSWSVIQKPAGAAPLFATPNTASSTVSGLTVSGAYTFRLTLQAGPHTVTRDVFFNRYNTEQPPYLWEFSPYRLGTYATGKPISIKSDALSMNNSPVTYSWSLISKPPGSTVTITNPTKNQSLTSNADIPGRYTFQLTATNAYGSKTDSFSVDVAQGSSTAPVVASISATPTGSGSGQLNVNASDSDGEALGYWWSMQSGPAGAAPVFSNPGTKNPTVSGLVAGSYIFNVAVFDSVNLVEQTVGLSVTNTDTVAPVAPTNLH